MLLSWIISLCAVAGLFVAAYIYRHIRQPQKQLVCPIVGSCHAVIHSKYAKVFGIENAYLGILYYLVVLIFSLLHALGVAIPSMLMALLFLMVSGALLFSVYLLFIQAFRLKNWCSWCLISAVLTLIIFLLSYVAYYR